MITDSGKTQATARTHPSPILTVSLSGDARSRGRQHGERFGGRVRESGILEYYREYAQRLVAGSAVRMELIELVQTYLATRFTEEAHELVAGFAEASKLNEADVARALVTPDLLGYLSCVRERWVGAPTLGCTSIAAWGEATAGGRFLYGRNLDFIGNGLFDRAPLVARHRPEKGHRYVSVSSAGCVIDGITGINEPGLTVDLHQHLNTHVSRLPEGRPIMDLGRSLLQCAGTVEEAVKLALAWKPVGAWSVVVTHWKRREVVVIEKTSKHAVVFRPRGDSVVYTNTYNDALLRAHEVDRPAFRESSRLRARRAETLLEEARGRLTPGALAAILGDHVDPERGQVRGFAQTLAQPHNLTSVVMDPEEGVLWLAEGRAPVCDTPYRRVELWSDTEPGEVLRRAADPLTPAQRAACQAYQSALRSWEILRDGAYAADALESAVENHPEDPSYRFMFGLMALKEGDVARAADSFAAGASLPDIEHRRAAQRLWQARALDVMGRRGEAVSAYRLAYSGARDRALAQAAGRGVDRRWKGEDVRPDFYHADAAL